MNSNDKLINEFVNYLKSKRKSNATIIAYSKDLHQLSEKFSKETPLKELTANDIRKFISEVDLKPKTLSRKLNSFRTFYKYLVDSKKISENPAMDVDHPKYTVTPPRVLTPVEYLALRQVTSDNARLYTMVELMLQTGIRIGELSRLKVGDVDLKKTRGYLSVTEYSTNPARTIELNNSATELLRKYLKTERSNAKPTDPLFATRDNNPIIIRNIRSSIDRGIEKAGIENACVNDLRNTFIYHQLKSGVPIDRVTDTVGHKSKSTTSRYLDLLEDYQPRPNKKLADV